jgi:hypothetical protein
MATVDKNFRVKNGLVVEGTTGTINGHNIVTDNDTTDILSEGTSNLYFTDQRAKDAVTSGVTTDGISEGTTNLYFTDERVQDVLVNSVQENIQITSTDGVLFITAENGVADSTTDDLDEGTVNLYFTEERAVSAVVNGEVNTDDIEEGTTNLYYTDSRARSAISGGTGIDYDSDSGVIDVDTTEIATREYVDAVSEGLHIHASVAVATTQDIGNLLSPPATIDGVTLVEGMRVLVKDQEGSTFNGIYVFEDGALVRAEDYDTAAEIQAGDFVFVEGGETYGSTGWVQLNSVSALGTDAIEWTQFLGAGTFVGGKGIAIDGQEVSIDFAEFDTDDIDEGTINLYYTDQRVEDVIAASNTDDISEGTGNLYYTTQRVYDDLANSVQENISITTTDGLLYITAENGVADSTTDDLDEGTTNLYFTDERAVDALEAVVPNFTEIEINSVSKQVAATSNVADAETATTVYSFDTTEYRSAKFIVKAASGSHTEISEVLVTLDSSDNVAITEYAIVSTNGNLIDVTAEEATGDVNLVVSAVNANTEVTVFGTLIK